MKEKSEMLAQQAKSAKAQVGSGPTITLVTPTTGREMGPRGIICGPNCLPNCSPSCEPTIFRPPKPPPPKPN